MDEKPLFRRLNIHALACRLVTQAHVILSTLGQVIPKFGPPPISASSVPITHSQKTERRYI